VLTETLEGLDRLDGGGQGGALAAVERRLAFAAALRARSIEDHAEAWRATIDAVAASAKYGGLRIAPQMGLVPLGPDPVSGLFEFAHVGSGAVPRRDAGTQRLVVADDGALVLVLLPGGTFSMGAQRDAADDANYEPQAEPKEAPVRKVTLSPFFLSKYECTQAQWSAMTDGEKPSWYGAGTAAFSKEAITVRHPVEGVSWDDSARWLGRHLLTLPTEAQWEYACRAGTTTPWFTGRAASDLGNVANVADRFCQTHGGPPGWQYTTEVDDGHACHAPVGTYAANAFGLHETHGNVIEWCRDAFWSYVSGTDLTDPCVEHFDSRTARGGSWGYTAGYARSAYRTGFDPGYRVGAIGVRPARALDPE
jgi:formylglycine-generating enzyme required for sulfatase activity